MYVAVRSSMTAFAIVLLPLAAAAATTTLLPDSYRVGSGRSGGQPVANLHLLDQSARADDPAKYVGFTTPLSRNLTWFEFTVPAAARGDAVLGLTLNVNYKGPARTTQLWSWALLDWGAARWVVVGDSRLAAARVWKSLAFRPARAARFVDPATGAIRVRLRSNNATGNAKIDFLAIDLAHLAAPEPGSGPTVAGCPLFPADNFWNTPVDALPVHPRSAAWVAAIGADTTFHMDFGSGTWDGHPIGIPYNVVPADQPDLPVLFDEYGDESDPGPYPIPADPAIEGGSDRHLLVVRQAECRLFELYHAHRDGTDWLAGCGATWDLASNALRPAGWTSSDLAGMPVLAGLARYEEVEAGGIRHALRFTAEAGRISEGYIWPARHPVPDLQDAYATLARAPLGARFRLKAAYPVPDDAPAQVRALLVAMKTYGIVLTDHGSNWYVTGAPDPRWDNDALHAWFDERLSGGDFEAVDSALLLREPDSGAAGRAP